MYLMFFPYIHFTVSTYLLTTYSFILAVQCSQIPTGWENGQSEGCPVIQYTLKTESKCHYSKLSLCGNEILNYP